MQEDEARTQDAQAPLLDERAQRRARRQELIAAGINPYPIKSHVDAHAKDIEEKYAGLAAGEDTTDVVTVAGRIRALRNQGKIAFIVLEDVTGQIQLFCRVNTLGESWPLVGELDLGDIVEATGAVVRTKRGQLSVAPTKLTLLSKSLRPLPEKFHGLTDREVRYRQRYVDLIMNPEVREVFRRRYAIISLIRRYMEADGYLEVETPVMHSILGGANAKPFVTHFNALDRDFYLRIATELPLKRLIVGGMERVFEIGRQFRNEGMDLTHNPEFTSMEAYCAYSDLEGMKELKVEMARSLERAQAAGTADINFPFGEGWTAGEVAASIRSVFEQTLAQTQSMLDMDTVEHAASLICTAHQVALFTESHNRYPASMFADRLLSVGIDARCEADTERQIRCALLMGKDCVAIGISYSGVSMALERALPVLSERGVPTFLVGTPAAARLNPGLDGYLFVSDAERYQRRITQFASHLAVQYVLDTLFGSVCATSWPRSISYLEKTLPLTRKPGLIDDCSQQAAGR